MPVSQPGTVITQGLGSKWLITQGFGVGAITETISPSNPFVAPSGTVVFTSNFASSWSASAGTLVVAGDNLSATWTAPGSTGSFTVTATDLSDPGNTATAYPVVVGPAGMTAAGEMVPASVLGANRSIIQAGG